MNQRHSPPFPSPHPMGRDSFQGTPGSISTDATLVTATLGAGTLFCQTLLPERHRTVLLGVLFSATTAPLAPGTLTIPQATTHLLLTDLVPEQGYHADFNGRTVTLDRATGVPRSWARFGSGNPKAGFQ